MEREPVRPTRPTLDEIRLYLRGTPFANWADLARRLAVAETLNPSWLAVSTCLADAAASFANVRFGSLADIAAALPLALRERSRHQRSPP
jgi:hypothetical protein